MKKRLAAWLAGLMVLSIAGCSGGGTAETTAAQTEATGTTVEATESSDEAEAVEIQLPLEKGRQ